jgi:hypothetical protein
VAKGKSMTMPKDSILIDIENKDVEAVVKEIKAAFVDPVT